MNLFKRKPKEETAATITLAEHERIVGEMQSTIDSYADNAVLLRSNNRALDNAANHFKQQRDAARIEAAANAEDAAKYRRSVANLKQNRPRDKQQAEVGA